MGCAHGLWYHVGRSWAGTVSASAGLAIPLGGWWFGGAHHEDEPDRLAHGLAIVLPGIEGRGPLNWGIYHGLIDGGFPGAVVLWDWTTGMWPLLVFHLRAGQRNRRCGEHKLPSFAFCSGFAQGFEVAIVKDINAQGDEHQLMNRMRQAFDSGREDVAGDIASQQRHIMLFHPFRARGV